MSIAKDVLALIGLVVVVKKGYELLAEKEDRDEAVEALGKVWGKAREVFQTGEEMGETWQQAAKKP